VSAVPPCFTNGAVLANFNLKLRRLSEPSKPQRCSYFDALFEE